MTGDEQGATSVEYGLICALIALAIFATVALVGDAVVAVFAEVMTLMGWEG